MHGTELLVVELIDPARDCASATSLAIRLDDTLRMVRPGTLWFSIATRVLGRSLV